MIIDRRLFTQEYKENEDLVSRIITKIKKVDQIKRHIEQANRKFEELKNEYESKLHDVEKELMIIRNDCDHKLTKYHGDPAGGSDSWIECEICGKEL